MKKFRYGDFGEPGVEEMLEGVNDNTTLKFIKCAFKAKHVSLVSDLFSKKTQLTSIIFVHNPDSGEPILEIIKSFPNNITALSINNNKFFLEMAKEFTKALKENTSITSFDFSRNSLNKLGMGIWIDFVDMLKTKAITDLNLSQCFITKEEVSYFLEALKENTSITNLDLSQNNLGEEGGMKVLETLQVNHVLKNIYLIETSISKQQEDDIHTILTHRNQIEDQEYVTIAGENSKSDTEEEF